MARRIIVAMLVVPLVSLLLDAFITLLYLEPMLGSIVVLLIGLSVGLDLYL